jgi:polyamine oxidase
MSIDAEVIIIGAGISGLKAAADLHEKNISTLVLEARPRTGGRIYTERSANSKYHYDLGASWFHCTMENPIFEKFVNEWYSPKDTVYDDAKVGFILDTKTGSFPKNCNIGPIVDEMKYFVANLKEDQSLQNSVIDFIKLRKNLLNKNEIKYSTALFKAAELMNGCDWSMIGSKFSYGPFNGRDSFNTIGYDKVIEKILQNYPMENIKLNEIVKNVEKIENVNEDDNEDKIIKITTTNGKIYKCKYLIVTIPLGVLKLSVSDPDAEGAITFTPELPKQITDNFSKTHFTTLSKVIVEFEEAFWPDNDKFLVLPVPKDDELDITKVYETAEFDNYENSEPVRAFEFPCLVANYNVVRKVPALMFLLPSQPSKQIESAVDPKKYGYELVKPIIAKMADILEFEIPEPKLVLTTNWHSDPFSRGAISTCAVNDIFINDALVDGFGNIRFAGENTSYKGRACAHGAYISGAREAAFIAKELGK